MLLIPLSKFSRVASHKKHGSAVYACAAQVHADDMLWWGGGKDGGRYQIGQLEYSVLITVRNLENTGSTADKALYPVSTKQLYTTASKGGPTSDKTRCS
jgi:hypothetical protein